MLGTNQCASQWAKIANISAECTALGSCCNISCTIAYWCIAALPHLDNLGHHHQLHQGLSTAHVHQESPTSEINKLHCRLCDYIDKWACKISHLLHNPKLLLTSKPELNYSSWYVLILSFLHSLILHSILGNVLNFIFIYFWWNSYEQWQIWLS